MTLGSWRGATPAFLMGMALSMMGLVAAGLLLYGGPGFLPALAVVLAVLFGSLAMGFTHDAGAEGRAAVEGARKLWLYALISFTLAAFFAVGWELFRGFGAAALTQAVGLALLVALPYYFGGRVLKGLADLPGTRGQGRVAAATLFGGGVGVLLVGFFLFPTLSPTAVILLSLVSVSGGALVHGWALDEVLWLERADRRTGTSGLLVVERWIRGTPRTHLVALRENGRLRAAVDGDGVPGLPEERAIADLVSLPDTARGTLLSVGVGAALLGEWMRRAAPGVDHRIALADEEGGRFLLDTPRKLMEPAGEAPTWHPVDAHTLLHRGETLLPRASADWILLDLLEVAATPGGVTLPGGGLERLHALLRPGGVLVAFPLLELPGERGLLEGVLERTSGFEWSALYVGSRDDPGGIVRLPEGGGAPRDPVPGGARRAFLVARAFGEEVEPEPLPESVAGFLQVPRAVPEA